MNRAVRKKQQSESYTAQKQETFGQNVQKQNRDVADAGFQSTSLSHIEDSQHMQLTSGQNVQKYVDSDGRANSADNGENKDFSKEPYKNRIAGRENETVSDKGMRSENKLQSGASSEQGDIEKKEEYNENCRFTDEMSCCQHSGSKSNTKSAYRKRKAQQQYKKNKARENNYDDPNQEQNEFENPSINTFGNHKNDFTAVKEQNNKKHNKAKNRKEKGRNQARTIWKKENSRKSRDDGRRTDQNSDRQNSVKNTAGSAQHSKNTAFKNTDADMIHEEKNLNDSSFIMNNKLRRKKRQAEKAGQRLEKAKGRMPKKRTYAFQRVFDEEKGCGRQSLVCTEREKPFCNRIEKSVMRGIQYEGADFVHRKISEVEKENSAVEGVHKMERGAEEIYSFAKSCAQGKAERHRKKIAGLERKYHRKEISFQHQKFLYENPHLKKKILHKQMQKRLIKKEYARNKRSRTAARMARTIGSWAAQVLPVEKIRTGGRPKSILTAAVILILFIFIPVSLVSSCSTVFSGIPTMVLASAYLSEPKEIDTADLEFTRLELGLQKKIDRIEIDYPDYDEYSYNLGEIGHNPFTLISYLSAVYTEFTYDQAEDEIHELFGEMYMLNIVPETTTGIREVQAADEDGRLLFDADGNPVMKEEEYEKSVLQVMLTVMPLETIVLRKMDTDQTALYEIYMESCGLLQQFGSPLELNWYQYVSSYYGYRKNMSSGDDELHRGLDIAVPAGTKVFAAHDGMVIEAAYDSRYGNYIVIKKDSYVTRYAHMDSLHVSTGQIVTKGDLIGKTGSMGNSTGSRLHLECLYDGEYYNPLFYFDVGTGSIYGEVTNTGGSSDSGSNVLPDSYDDAAVESLMEEASKYIGVPYVWGGSSPSTGFDCSGFVCWVFTNSGVHNLPRTTAQNIYEQCIPVSEEDAKAGDIIFFTGTYASSGPVSHVGIYCGNGIMVHAGSPVNYTSINTPYWQTHYFSFGRLK